jgi:hypothetical protein
MSKFTLDQIKSFLYDFNKESIVNEGITFVGFTKMVSSDFRLFFYDLLTI